MSEKDRKREELLRELARRFRDSANTLRDVARKINDAAESHRQTMRRVERAGDRLRDCIGGDNSPTIFTYVEFLEFSTAEEFRKFKILEPITDEDLSRADLDDLTRRLQEI